MYVSSPMYGKESSNLILNSDVKLLVGTQKEEIILTNEDSTF